MEEVVESGRGPLRYPLTGCAVVGQGAGFGPEQPVTGETDRPRNNKSMEGRRGFRRLTGQKAEPPCGVKFTLLGSGQEG